MKKDAAPPARFAIRIDEGAKGKITALAYRGPPARARATLILGHGAGSDQRHAFMVGMAKRLRDRGVDVVTYNFLYTEQKRRLPDRNDALERCVSAVVREVRAQRETRAAALFLGGKSMGGRIASQVAAKDLAVAGALAGLVFLGYPLHPPGKPEKLRDAHLYDVRAPMLFVQGARDAFGTPAELTPILAKLPRARLHTVEEGDHSLVVPKRLGIAQGAIYDGVADVIARWIFEAITSASC